MSRHDSLPDRARGWIYSQLVATESCMERLGAIRNDAVNHEAQQSTLGRMAEETRMLRYILGLFGDGA